MNIKKETSGTNLTITLEGRLDTVTAPELEAELKQSLDGITNLVFDITGVEYISSAGLRVLLSAQKIMNKQGEMSVRGASDAIMEIFDVTGFIDLINIQQ